MARCLVFVSILTLWTCSSERAGPLRATPVVTLSRATPRSGPPPAPRLPLEPAELTGAVSAGGIAIARLGERTFAFVADTDDSAVVTFDVDTREPLASTPIGARPAAVLVTKEGRVVALGADDARVHVLSMSQVDRPLVAERVIAVPEEPVSAVLVPGGDAILVTSRWGHSLSVVPGLHEDAAVAPTVIDLPRDPAAVVTSPDGRRAFVLHAVGSRASVVDLESRSTRTISLDRKILRARFMDGEMMKPMPMENDSGPTGFDDAKVAQPITASQAAARKARKERLETVTLHADQGFALVRTKDGPLAPVVAVDTGADARSSGYGGGEAAATPAIVSFDDEGAAAPAGRRIFGSRCLLPRGAALDASSGKMFVACLGSDEIGVFRMGPHGMTLQPAVRVSPGPVAVAVDDRGRRAVVWSQFGRVVTVLSIAGKPEVVAKASLAGATPALPDDVLRGRSLFNAAFDERVSSDGRACASCHPDARDDGLAWSSPGGRRETPMLVERLEGTAPYGWDGAAKDLARHLAHTTDRLGGSGLAKQDVADIQAYIATLRTPAAARAGRADDDALVARGKALFQAEDTGCAGCHAGEALTDGDTHDVRSSSREDLRRAFDTPSLHLIAASAPYFHDGRYATLSDVLSGSDGTMGHTSQLTPDDRLALEAYLRRL